MRAIFTILILALGGAPGFAQQQAAIDPARVDAAVKSAFPTAPADWQSRLVPDETMRQCSAHRNAPPKAVAAAIQEREKTTIIYPSDGKLLGDWKQGSRINLELSLKLGDELGGHLVYGHVDGVGTIVSMTPEGGSMRFVFEAPGELARHRAEAGWSRRGGGR